MSPWALVRYGIYAFSHILLFFCLCMQHKVGSSRLTKSLGAVAWASWAGYKWKVPVHSSSVDTPVCPGLMVAVFGTPFETSHGCCVWGVPSCLMDALKIVCVCGLTVHFCWQWTAVAHFSDSPSLPIWSHYFLYSHQTMMVMLMARSLPLVSAFSSNGRRSPCLLHIPGL